jgi:membrane-bound lytic murein transglycosylase F
MVSNDLGETFDGLISHRYDLIAKSLTITRQRNKQIDFTVSLLQTSQVLVQRSKSEDLVDTTYVSSALELAGKKVYVQKNTTYYRRLLNLSDEIGADIEIVEDTIYGVEQLVEQVAEGEINYTVCDENVAKLNKAYYPNLDVSLKISLPQNIAWGVRNGSKEWKEYLDKWITKFKKTRKFKQIYYRYFESPRVVQRMESDFHSISGGKISGYDGMIKQEVGEYNWDWRLISAIIYQESRFNDKADSWAGAYGLMQLMPSTAHSLGIDDYKNPKENVKGGILLLNWLDEQFSESIPDSTERVKFVLASYNIGLGHVKDAQRLAKKYGKNNHVWENNVDFFLRNKSAEKYYKDPVVRWGYCRGKEAYEYVNKVLTNYHHYLNVIPEG